MAAYWFIASVILALTVMGLLSVCAGPAHYYTPQVPTKIAIMEALAIVGAIACLVCLLVGVAKLLPL